MMGSFDYRPTPAVLDRLSQGQLVSRWQRSLRLWWLLRSLYGQEANWQASLPNPFRYADLRDQVFAPSHGTADHASVEELSQRCQGSQCLCQRSLQALLAEPDMALDWPTWVTDMQQKTGLSESVWQTARLTRPFYIGHRSLRDDLKVLVGQGWLKTSGRGYFALAAVTEWPIWSIETDPLIETAPLSTAETWELLSVLESVAFVQPNLSVLVNRLWEQAAHSSPQHHGRLNEPERRIFIHLDYVLSPEMQEQVDTHQSTIEQLWQRSESGIIQFDYWLTQQQRTVTVTVYPVCFHYARRAKYLSAFGNDPNGTFGWHNYRLDRIVSERVTVIPWGNPKVPKSLKEKRDCGELPAPRDVEEALEQAWGFNFYLPRSWLLMRFSAWFARWYVDQTERHETFGPVTYEALPSMILQHVPTGEQAMVKEVLRARSPQDVYYAGWVRMGDINVVMRLRDWRPQGEVIAPWGLRQQMAVEVQQEIEHYKDM
ncbi:MAG: TIGR03985 family CRISPR-associated protein [Leptolyngbya sp. SIOISBB]|nr:TIGR03985 family CRISPR-associated protein [Leptolyngbya sp. SIOISBB]